MAALTPREYAAQLRERARRDGSFTVSPEEIRAALGRSKLTHPVRQQLETALRRAGLAADRDLVPEALSAPVTITRMQPWQLAWWQRRSRALAVGAVLFAVLLGFGDIVDGVTAVTSVGGKAIGLVRSDPEPPLPDPMTDDVNVLVAPFAAHGAASERDGAGLASTVAAELGDALGDAERAHRMPMAVKGPAGLDPLARDEVAEAAERHRADLVVFGDVRSEGGREQVDVRLYVTGRRLPDAGALAGVHPLASVWRYGPIDDSPAHRQRLRAGVADALRAPLSFAVGATRFEQHDWAAARRRFADAAAVTSQRRLAAFAFLVAANASGKLGDHDAAARAYRDALASKQPFPRALNGLAEVERHRAQHGCEPGRARRDGLLRSLRHSEAALASADPGALTVRLRAHLSAGRTLHCLSAALLEDRRDDAALHLRAVLALGAAAGTTAFRSERAEAHATLGAIAMPAVGERDADAYRRARAQYVQARDFASEDRRRTELFDDWIAYVDERLAALR